MSFTNHPHGEIELERSDSEQSLPESFYGNGEFTDLPIDETEFEESRNPRELSIPRPFRQGQEFNMSSPDLQHDETEFEKLPIPRPFRQGQRRTFTGLDAKKWAFLVVSTINILVTAVLTFVSLYDLIKNGKTHTSEMTYIILILVNSVFFIVYTLTGLMWEREFELYALVCAILLILAYCIIHYLEEPDYHYLALANLIVHCVLAPPNIALAIIVAIKFGGLEFRIVGAASAFQRMYRETTRFSSVLLFDLQITVDILILVLKNGTEVSTFEIVVLAVGIPVSLLWICIGWVAMKYESKIAVAIFFFLGLLEPTYIILRLYYLYKIICDPFFFFLTDGALFYGQIVACAVALLVRSIGFFEMYRVMKNFGKGLQERVKRGPWGSRAPDQSLNGPYVEPAHQMVRDSSSMATELTSLLVHTEK